MILYDPGSKLLVVSNHNTVLIAYILPCEYH